MSIPKIEYCPGTLAKGFDTYSRTCQKNMFGGKKVSHVLKYNSPITDLATNEFFESRQKNISISGVQEKFSVILDKNILRLVKGEERGTHILKPIPSVGKKADQMPANEHLTMQIAKQVYKINTAENALIFFKNGAAAYLTKRFDRDEYGQKLAQEDFAALAGRTPQTHGDHYKYAGNYLVLFELMKQHLPAYRVEAVKLFKMLLFNYLFSNGDAHFKNFSLLETPMGDFIMSPAYDLLNSKIHIDDADFALEEGLLPPGIGLGKIPKQFKILAKKADINEVMAEDTIQFMINQSTQVAHLIQCSFLNSKTKKSYFQHYQKRLKKLSNFK